MTAAAAVPAGAPCVVCRAAAGRTWQVRVPAPAAWLTSNQRGDRLADAAHVRQWRHATGWRAKAVQLPRGLARVHILALLNLNPMPRRFDPGNWYPTAKAAVDGLVDVGLVADDNADLVIGPDMRRGVPSAVPGGELLLVITDLEEG